MHMPNFLDSVLITKIPIDTLAKLRQPCRPRILVVVDGLDYQDSNAFGLWRFIHGITVASGVTNKPILTLAHRAMHATPTVTVGTDTYTIQNSFTFGATVTLANYDQVWIFAVGDGGFSLSNPEVAVISEFMNSGGGVFATGDHASLGRELCGSLPRIRHMREWRDTASGGVPMGTEADVTKAVNRIDTVVNPGGNARYEFEDQSDAIPQRIYPNYRVIDTDGLGGSAWTATVHPLLMLPGALVTRSGSNLGGANLGFTLDMDVLPDHPHESVCYEVTASATLAGQYNLSGQNFAEFQPNAAVPAQRVGAEIVAYAVSGGRSVLNGVWKPPVRPRMFGVIAAYDGRLAQAYPGKTARPGRIVCDSTWHHYVNVNLDGTGSGRAGLGTGSGAGFVPSPDLEKIYTYYRNIIFWLQPANRIWCRIWWDLVAIRFSPNLFEELLDIDRLVNWRDLVGLGREARALITQVQGSEALRDQILGLLLADVRTQVAADLLASGQVESAGLDSGALVDGAVGALLKEIAHALPPHTDGKTVKAFLEKGPDLKQFQEHLTQAIGQGIAHQAERAERSIKFAQRMNLKSAK